VTYYLHFPEAGWVRYLETEDYWEAREIALASFFDEVGPLYSRVDLIWQDGDEVGSEIFRLEHVDEDAGQEEEPAVAKAAT
jgi:hypothetical protein